MHPPRFWTRPPSAPGVAARLLAPLSWIWRQVTRRRLAAPPGFRAGIPVICIGNLSIGGAGKTPTVLALIERLAARGLAVHVLSRGHGGRLAGPVRVDLRAHSAADVGDEPLLIAPFVPVWVGRYRAASARAAVADGAQVIVMDDGFQNRALAIDLAIVVVDAVAGFGNGRVIPSGPLREPVADGLARADVVLAIGPARARTAFLETWPEVSALPVIGASLDPLPTGMDWDGLRVLAFAGIGRPEKFFATVKSLGATVIAQRAFDDHAVWSAKILARLEAEALASGAQLVTTEKDAVRLPPSFRPKVLVVPVRLNVADWSPVDAALDRMLPPREG